MAITINGQHAEYEDVKDTFPQSSTLTGTISSANNGEFIVGVGTAFTTELEIGQWIFVAAHTECRQIRSIASDTELYLYFPFTSALSADTGRKVPRQTYSMISWKIDSTGAASIDGIEFEADNSGSLAIDEISRKRPEPIIMDSTTNDNIIYVQFKK